MIQVNVTVEHEYTLSEEEEEKIEAYAEVNQVSLYTAFIDLLDGSEIDQYAHDDEITETNIDTVTKI